MTRRTGLRVSEETYLVNTFNFIITKNFSEPDSSLKIAVDTDGVTDCLAHHNGNRFYDNYWGVPVIGAYRWIPERKLCIVTEMDESEALAPIVSLRNKILLIGLIIGVSVMVIGVFFARTITIPVQRLAKGTQEIGQGNLNYRVGTASKDEIGQLSRAFDQMVEALKMTTVSRDELAEEVTERKRTEAALRASGERYHHTLDAMLEGCQIIGSDWRYLYLNDVADKHNRRPKEELLGKKYMDMWPGIESTAVFAVIQRTMEEHVPQSMENKFMFPDGSMGWFELRIYSVPEGIVILSVDITDRKQAEGSLRRYAERLAAINRLDRIISSNLEIALVYDNFVKELVALVPLDRTSLLLVNEAQDQWQVVRQWTHYQPVILPGEWMPVKGSAVGWLVTNRVPFLENEIGERGNWVETAPLQREGLRSRLLLPLIIQTQIVGVLTAASREPSAFSEEDQHILATIADQLAIAVQNARLYEQVQRYAAELEQRVIERTAELSDLYNNAPCGYHSLDANGVFERVNDTELAWLGYTREEMIGKVRFPDLLTPTSVQTFQKNFPVFKARGWVSDLEFDMLRKDSTILSVLLSATAIVDQEGRYLSSRSTIINHTERKHGEEALRQRTEQLEAANKELEAFSYSVSHDLRAPLRAIDGFSRIVLRDYAPLLPDEGQRRLQSVRDSAQQMGRLIDDLLAFSRLGRQPIQKRMVSPSHLARVVFEELSHERENRQVEITIGEMPDCQADPALLKQVFVNLLSNALKFTRPREVAQIEAGVLQPDGKPIYFVKDNGVGFDMQYSDKLFGVFQRLHRAEEFEGTGVGLAIVQRIVYRHGGRVWAESQVDQGATFYFMVEGEPVHE
ncbi:MAG: PAS domain-containing protein [Chloroflexi bacterium]|nr:PAS domain-containing protein [Chloroflexota bacterium]